MFHRDRFESELDDELRDHLERYTADLIAGGMDRAEARRKALREFGNAANVKEDVRSSAGIAWMDTLTRNVRFGLRMLRKSPAFAWTVTLTLGLCIGANTAIFSIVDALLFRPLPYPEPHRLGAVTVLVQSPQGGGEMTSVDGFTWEYLRDRTKSLDVGLFSTVSEVNLLPPDGRAQYAPQLRVNSGYFRVLGVAPVLGREFTREEDRPGGAAVAVIGGDLWKRAFHGDPSVLGRRISLRGEPYTVVGVMPEGFDTRPHAELWTPLRASTQGEGSSANFGTVARVVDGYTWEQAQAELASAAPQSFVRNVPRDVSARLKLGSLQAAQAEDLRKPLLLLWAAVGIVLLIGCVNVAGLLLARGSARRQEIATRLALGSGRSAILGQLLTEGLLLAAGGGAIGVALGWGALEVLRNVAADALGITQTIAIDGRVLAVTGVAAVLTSILFGLYPAIETARLDLRQAMGSGTRSVKTTRAWTRHGLVVCEVALGTMLLVGAGLVLRTLLHFIDTDPGYDGSNVMTASLPLQDARYSKAADVRRLFDTSLDSIRRQPGVEAAGVSLALPYERGLNDGVRIMDGPAAEERRAIASVSYVSPGFFEALRYRLRQGRLFTDRDRQGSPAVAIVNEAFLRQRLHGDTGSIGRHVQMDVPREIAGIVGDVQQRASFGGGAAPVRAQPHVYIPVAQVANDGYFALIHTWFQPKWVVRSAGGLANVEQVMRAAAMEADPRLPFARFRAMDQFRGDAFALQRLETMLLGALAGLALLLAAVGMYGLIAHLVAERTREFGVRMALGASVGRTVLLAVRPGVAMAAVGIALGIMLASQAGSYVESLLAGVISPRDVPTYAVAAGVLAGVVLLASAIPSARVARIDPARVLRD